MADDKKNDGRTDGSNSDDFDLDQDSIPADHVAEGQANAQSGAAAGAMKPDADKFKNDYLYLRAEFENFKKQAVKERSDLRKYGAERLVADLLNVLDIFETALATELNVDNIANFKKGIELTSSELRSVLQRHGVAEVPSKGVAFDPAVHEALSSQETSDVEPGTITQVFKKPYKLHDRIVRPGQVVVARSKS